MISSLGADQGWTEQMARRNSNIVGYPRLLLLGCWCRQELPVLEGGPLCLHQRWPLSCFLPEPDTLSPCSQVRLTGLSPGT